MFTDFREKEGGVGEREKEKREKEEHCCERETLIGCLPYVPQLGIKPTTYWCMNNAPKS